MWFSMEIVLKISYKTWHRPSIFICVVQKKCLNAVYSIKFFQNTKSFFYKNNTIGTCSWNSLWVRYFTVSIHISWVNVNVLLGPFLSFSLMSLFSPIKSLYNKISCYQLLNTRFLITSVGLSCNVTFLLAISLSIFE